MNVTGIIAEYNPFHNGHDFHIEETRRQTGADYCIAVMSGDFVQRGAPALLNKYDRAKMALENGIDLVVELPVTAAVSSAESFARGGVCLLDALGVVSRISFGAELTQPSDAELLAVLADFFATEPPSFREQLDLALKSGCSFPSARAQAALHCMKQTHADTTNLLPLERLLASPNNILAIEYEKAIRQNHADLQPCIISRKGAGYHDTDTDTHLASASALRRFFFRYLDHPTTEQESTDLLTQTLERTVPASVRSVLEEAFYTHQFLQEDDFSDLLYYELHRRMFFSADTEHPMNEIASDLEQRITNRLEQFTCWSEFVADLKTKNQTYTAISRFLLHALLGMDATTQADMKACHYAPYARILGFRKDAAPLLKELQMHSRIPLLRKIARERQTLTPAQQRLLDLDISAADLYNRILYTRSGIRRRNEYREPLIII